MKQYEDISNEALTLANRLENYDSKTVKMIRRLVDVIDKLQPENTNELIKKCEHWHKETGAPTYKEAAQALRHLDEALNACQVDNAEYRQANDSYGGYIETLQARIEELEEALQKIIDEDDSYYLTATVIAEKALAKMEDDDD